MSLTEANRLRLIDIFRLFCIFYIGVFHTWMVFYDDPTSYGSGISIFEWVEGALPVLTYHSGLFIVAISFFLFGFKEKNLPFWRWPAFLLGAAFTQFNGEENADIISISSWKWGVFSFLMVAYLLAWLSQKMPKKWQLVFLLGWVALAFIPVETLAQISHSDLPTIVKQALIGDWVAEDMWSGWFLVPWLFYPLFFMAFGILARTFTSTFEDFHLKWDLGFQLLTAASWAYFFTHHNSMTLGIGFDASVFQKNWKSILPLVLLPTLIFRISMLQSVRNVLDSRWTAWVSKLAWNRFFWLCYLLHLLWLFGMASMPFADTLKTSPYVEWVLLAAYVLPELYGQLQYRRWLAWKVWIEKRRQRNLSTKN